MNSITYIYIYIYYLNGNSLGFSLTLEGNNQIAISSHYSDSCSSSVYW